MLSRPTQLILYITPASTACQRALRAVRDILDEYDAADVDLQVLDPAEQPEAAERDRVVATPTLVRRSPRANTWIVGDLSNPHVLADVLQMGRR